MTFSNYLENNLWTGRGGGRRIDYGIGGIWLI